MSPQWILVIVLIGLVYFLFIKKKPLANENSTTTKKKKKEKLDEDDMVECESCGTYITLNDALLRDGSYFCSNECLKA